MGSDSIPADINQSIKEKCNLKCKLELGYEGAVTINTRVKEQFNEMSHTDNSDINSGIVKYNGVDRTLKKMFILKKSIHKYSEFSADAELLMYHEGGSGIEPLIISIPIIHNNSGGKLDEIIADSEDDINVVFNPYDIVPVNKPFYAYKANIPDDLPIGPVAEMIVFSKRHALTAQDVTFDKLTEHSITTFFTTAIGEQITYNENGASKTSDSEFPLIDCRPYDDVDPDAADINTPIVSLDFLSNADLEQWASLAIVQIIIGIFLITFLYYVFNFIFKSSNKIEIDGNGSPIV